MSKELEEKTKIAKRIVQIVHEFEEELRKSLNTSYNKFTKQMIKKLKNVDLNEKGLIMVQTQMLITTLSSLTANAFLTTDKNYFSKSDGAVNINFLKEGFDKHFAVMIEGNIKRLLEERNQQK